MTSRSSWSGSSESHYHEERSEPGHSHQTEHTEHTFENDRRHSGLYPSMNLTRNTHDAEGGSGSGPSTSRAKLGDVTPSTVSSKTLHEDNPEHGTVRFPMTFFLFSGDTKLIFSYHSLLCFFHTSIHKPRPGFELRSTAKTARTEPLPPMSPVLYLTSLMANDGQADAHAQQDVR